MTFPKSALWKFAFVAAIAVGLTASSSHKPSPRRASPRPNLVLVNLDDVDWEMFREQSLTYHFPNIGRLAHEGVRFTNVHCTTPLCGPSRACLYRGQYAHRIGYRVNSAAVPISQGFEGGYPTYQQNNCQLDDLPVWLKRAGYRTMMIGKYLHADFDQVIPSGWDDFYASFGGSYFGTTRFTNRDHPLGQRSSLSDSEYRTTAEADDMVSLIRRQAIVEDDAPQPFFLYLAPLTAHATSTGEERVEPQYRNWWRSLRAPLRPDFNEADVSDKPPFIAAIPPLNESEIEWMHAEFRERMLTMISVDRMIGRLFDVLQETGQLEETVIFFTSDNGYQLGHHRLTGKQAPYQRATNVPLFVWGNGVAAGATSGHLLAQLDIAPTLVEIAGGQPPSWIDGRSFVPLLAGPASYDERDWRAPILLENWASVTTHRGIEVPMAYTALRLFDELYVEWFDGTREYYDLAADPYQLRNAFGILDPAAADYLAAELRAVKQGDDDPVVATSQPWDAISYARDVVHLEGLAEAGAGLKAVRLLVRDPATRNYWNGQGWQSAPAPFTAHLDNPDAILSHWTFTFPWQENLGTAPQLVVVARAVARSGPFTQQPVTKTIVWDRLPPDTTLVQPTQNVTLANPVRLSGTARDERALDHVELVIRDLASGGYWNGEQFVADRTVLRCAATDGGEWSLSTPLPTGRYGVWARAYDTVGNYDPEPAKSHFYVE